MNKLKYLLKDLFLSNLKRIFKNIRYINSTTIIGKAKLENVQMAEFCSFADNCFVVNSKIGQYSSIGRNTTVINANIGNFCSISWNTTIGATQHFTDRLSTHAFYYVTNYGFAKQNEKIVETVTLGHDVWVGANVVIMPKINIGNGAIIGAGSVVTKDVPEYAIVVGNPARILKYRFNENKINEIKSLQWWYWNMNKLKENINIFKESVNRGEY